MAVARVAELDSHSRNETRNSCVSPQMYNQGAKGYQEALLVDTLDRMRRNPEGRKVVRLHLSQLLPPNRT